MFYLVVRYLNVANNVKGHSAIVRRSTDMVNSRNEINIPVGPSYYGYPNCLMTAATKRMFMLAMFVKYFSQTTHSPMSDTSHEPTHTYSSIRYW